MPQTLVKFPTNVVRTPESRPRKVAICPIKTRIKSKKATVTLILGRINALRLPNGRYQKLQPPALPESSSECLSPTRSSNDVAAMWTSASDATSIIQTMSSLCTTPSSSDLIPLIYSTFILNHLKSNSNLELNLHKNVFCKVCYFQLISFFDNALSAQPQSYKSQDSVFSCALCFLGF